MNLYMVDKRPMTLKGGIVRQPGELLPEAVDFTARAKKGLIDSGLMTRVIVLTQKQYKKLEGALSVPQ